MTTQLHSAVCTNATNIFIEQDAVWLTSEQRNTHYYCNWTQIRQTDIDKNHYLNSTLNILCLHQLLSQMVTIGNETQ